MNLAICVNANPSTRLIFVMPVFALMQMQSACSLPFVQLSKAETVLLTWHNNSCRNLLQLEGFLY
ncbi:MAG TPA: hypothetical protein DEV81_17780 [Cyanobacteria bacterium UBA11049]|nr:hypothetical protein [Cyanobacteria bacterium UBA11049]